MKKALVGCIVVIAFLTLAGCGGGGPSAPVITSFNPASGRAGAALTLTGINFTGATEVRINSTPATFTVESATSITTTVPAGASSGPISVTTPFGTATSPASFTVTELPGDCPVATPTEVFEDLDKPVAKALTIGSQSWGITTPWGYNKAGNAARSYPLVVNGCWGEGRLFGDDVRKKFPAFYLNFASNCDETDGATLSALIDMAILADYRIDMNRIYLTGFSAGGSGSFKIVRGMLANGKLFAGIVRVAGQSESILAEAAVERTSLWYHIGLADSQTRINVARATYSNLKGHTKNATAVESTKSDNVTGFSRTTKTLTKNGVEIVKMSEYQGMGHDPDPCYKDAALFDWLFSQSLACR